MVATDRAARVKAAAERVRLAHEHAERAHRRAAQLHAYAALLFARHGKHEKAAAERAMADSQLEYAEKERAAGSR